MNEARYFELTQYIVRKPPVWAIRGVHSRPEQKQYLGSCMLPIDQAGFCVKSVKVERCWCRCPSSLVAATLNRWKLKLVCSAWWTKITTMMRTKEGWCNVLGCSQCFLRTSKVQRSPNLFETPRKSQ